MPYTLADPVVRFRMFIANPAKCFQSPFYTREDGVKYDLHHNKKRYESLHAGDGRPVRQIELSGESERPGDRKEMNGRKTVAAEP